MIGLELTVKIYSQKRMEFLQAFEMFQSNDGLYPERTGLRLFEKVNEINTFLWQEEWKSSDALTLYCQENRFRAMIGAINILGELIHHNQVIFEEELTNG